MGHRRALERIGHGDRGNLAGVVEFEQVDGVLEEAGFAVVEDEVENRLGVVAGGVYESVSGCGGWDSGHEAHDGPSGRADPW